MVFACGGQVGAHRQERAGARLGAPAAGDLLLEFDHPDQPYDFGEIGNRSILNAGTSRPMYGADGDIETAKIGRARDMAITPKS